MDNRKQITVIGATGNIGAPVVKNLVNEGFQVKAITRNTDKARKLFDFSESVEIVKADLRDVQSLQRALKNTDYLYLNLSTHTTDVNIPFAEEREGIENILKAIDKTTIKQIIQISGLGALDNHDSTNTFRFVPNIIRKQGQKLIKETGIPYTILHCSWFLDSFIFYQRNNLYSVIGNDINPIYFTNCYDFTQHLIHAIGNEKAFFKEFPVQGKMGYAHSNAARKFLSIFSEKSKVKTLPIPMIIILATFIKKLKIVKHMSDYFNNFSESHIADEYGTYSVLDEPKFDIETYAKWLKANNFYGYLNNQNQ
ncbi:MAG: NAD(P)-binding oxidoreductase [Bacteroidota bacterium]